MKSGVRCDCVEVDKRRRACGPALMVLLLQCVCVCNVGVERRGAACVMLSACVVLS